MRITAVVRVMNEDDIIEAFVRHTLSFVDNILLLDNGSKDRTIDILRLLRNEGHAITVVQKESPIFSEVGQNTLLYHTANQAFAPDWIMHLDADEFIDARAISLRDMFSQLPGSVDSVSLRLRNYFLDGKEAVEPIVPLRMVMRDSTRREIYKCALRGGLSPDLSVSAGNHEAFVGAERVTGIVSDAVTLAHFPERDPVQSITKAVLGRIKFIAAGRMLSDIGDFNDHYSPIFRMVRDNPASIFGDQARMNCCLPLIPLTWDPIDYRGGSLIYTHTVDYYMKAIGALVTAMDLLAQSHGSLLDASPAAQARLLAEATKDPTHLI